MEKTGRFVSYAVVALIAICDRPALLKAEAPRFEVISIRPTDPRDHQGSSWRTSPAGDLTLHAEPLIAVIANAYEVGDYQVTGYPPWVAQDSYDVVAKAAPTNGPGNGNSKEQQMLRLRSLLEDRCNIVVRHGSRKMAAYVVTVDSRGAKLEAAPENLQGSVFHQLSVHADTLTVAQLVNFLSGFLAGPIVDHTGLSGTYKFDLNWSSMALTRRDSGSRSSARSSRVAWRAS